MTHARILLFLLAAALATGCASPPYSKSGVAREQAMADYQDCYSKGSLDHFTPGQSVEVDAAAKACMRARGYSKTLSFPWW
jgi:hypothetical protein